MTLEADEPSTSDSAERDDDTTDPVAVDTATSGRSISSIAAAITGVLAAGLALGTSELLSGLTTRIPSLIVRVGDTVIENVPGSIERWAIETLGENDKPALVIGIVVISLLIGAVTGIGAARRFSIGWVVFAAFGFIGGLAAASDPQTSAVYGWLTAVVSAVVGVVALTALLRLAHPETSAVGSPQAVDRRKFVSAAGAAAALGVATPMVGSSLRRRQAAETEADREQVAAALDVIRTEPTTAPESVQAPQAEPADMDQLQDMAAGVSLGAVNFDDVDGITPLVIPNDEFYRIDAALSLPQVDVDKWTMRVTGMVDRELEFSFNDLLAMDPVEELVTLSCVSNEVGGDLVGNARWLGVPLKKILDMAGVQPDASQIVGRSVDGWTGGFPTAYLDDPDRVALVALAMNGEPLPVRHGFPVRLVIAGLYGYVSATKWLKEIELTTLEDFDGYWITRGWSKLGPIKTQSRIDVPRHGVVLERVNQAIAGVAWAPDRGVDRVEVQISPVVDSDEQLGDWTEAELSSDVTDNSWRQWFLSWDPDPGDYTIRVRATDGDGSVQTAERSRPDPDGATGHHAILVRVE